MEDVELENRDPPPLEGYLDRASQASSEYAMSYESSIDEFMPPLSLTNDDESRVSEDGYYYIRETRSKNDSPTRSVKSCYLQNLESNEELRYIVDETYHIDGNANAEIDENTDRSCESPHPSEERAEFDRRTVRNCLRDFYLTKEEFDEMIALELQRKIQAEKNMRRRPIQLNRKRPRGFSMCESVMGHGALYSPYYIPGNILKEYLMIRKNQWREKRRKARMESDNPDYNEFYEAFCYDNSKDEFRLLCCIPKPYERCFDVPCQFDYLKIYRCSSYEVEIYFLYNERWYEDKTKYLREMREAYYATLKYYKNKVVVTDFFKYTQTTASEYYWFRSELFRRMTRSEIEEAYSRNNNWIIFLFIDLDTNELLQNLPPLYSRKARKRLHQYAKQGRLTHSEKTNMDILEALYLLQKRRLRKKCRLAYFRRYAAKHEELDPEEANWYQIESDLVFKMNHLRKKKLRLERKMECPSGYFSNSTDSDPDCGVDGGPTYVMQQLRKLFIHELHTLLLLLETQNELSSGNILRAVPLINQASQQFGLLSNEMKPEDTVVVKSTMELIKKPRNNLAYWFMHSHKLLSEKLCLYASDILAPPINHEEAREVGIEYFL
ncbi:unnamed protein product [Caenorhabditis bovis]|uniref:Uncharacterized protein n=1 Tax=Caenorhabditis bovis TaxID=2654633 RepID=A0A8S1EEL9_9PELO|nr:unnamed protein product [Caenorhabditis bovis]